MRFERPMLIKLAIALALLLAILWSATSLSEAVDTASQAKHDVEACRQMAKRIEQLGQATNQSGAAAADHSEYLHRRGQEALAQLGIPGDRLVQITQDPPQSIGQTAYKEVPTHVGLRDVTLRQVVGFLLTVTGDRSSLLVKSIRIYNAQEAAGDVQWTADLTLSHVIYEPPQAVKVVSAD